jgi:hypothetical protein
VARSEAWRLSLAALAGTPPSRAAIHSANAGAFVAGALEAHAAMPARVALLRRLAPHQLPHPTHLAVADVPILLLEAAGAAALLGVTGAWWAPPGALAALLAARLAAGRRATSGLAILADVRRRAALAVLVGCIVGCGLARVWLVLAVAHLDASPAAAAAAFAALGRLRPAAARSLGSTRRAAAGQRRGGGWRRRRARCGAGVERDVDRGGAGVWGGLGGGLESRRLTARPRSWAVLRGQLLTEEGSVPGRGRPRSSSARTAWDETRFPNPIPGSSRTSPSH